MFQTFKNKIQEKFDTFFSFIQEDIDSEFSDFYELYKIEFLDNFSPDPYFMDYGVQTTNSNLLIEKYKKEIHFFNQDFYGVLFMHFKTRKWSAISFLLNKQYNFHFNMNLIEYQKNVTYLNEACIQTLYNLHSSTFNKSARMRV